MILVAGIPLSGDFYSKLDEAVQGYFNPRAFRLSHNTAYHANVGLEYKF